VTVPGTDTQARSRSGGIGGISQLPALELPALNGVTFRSWDYRSRTHLVLLFTDDPEAALVSSETYRSLRAENAELIIIGTGWQPGEQYEGPGVLAWDQDGVARTKLGIDGSEVLVANKNGTVYWRETFGSAGPNLSEALSWLGYINIIEPECGCCAPVWPILES
jgi:hypothetical protein